MILPRKRLLVDIFFTRRLSKSLAVCEFASVNFEPCKTRNTENVAYENCSDPCGCWCAWYSEEGYGRKHQESIRESYYDRDSKDLHAGICANPQKGTQCMNRMIDLSD